MMPDNIKTSRIHLACNKRCEDRMNHKKDCFEELYLIFGELEDKLLCAPLKLSNNQLVKNDRSLNLQFVSLNEFEGNFHFETELKIKNPLTGNIIESSGQKWIDFESNPYINLDQA
jgi:hypothetical protein